MRLDMIILLTHRLIINYLYWYIQNTVKRLSSYLQLLQTHINQSSLILIS